MALTDDIAEIAYAIEAGENADDNRTRQRCAIEAHSLLRRMAIEMGYAKTIDLAQHHDVNKLLYRCFVLLDLQDEDFAVFLKQQIDSYERKGQP